MGTRIFLGLTLIGVLAGIFILDHAFGRPWGFAILCAIAGVLALKEGSRLVRARGLDIDWVVLVASQIAMLCFLFFGFPHMDDGKAADSARSSALLVHTAVTVVTVSLLLPLAVAARAIARALWDPNVSRIGDLFSGTLTLHFYISVPVAIMLGLRMFPGVGEWLVIWLIAVCRLGSDSCAYFAGKALGRHKLIPYVSPGKTFEGLIGGMVGSVAVGAALWWMIEGLRVWHGLWVIMGLSLAVGIVAAFGDLLESALKRGAAVKDSGAVLPAFGGVLDVIDGFLLAVPATFVFVLIESLRG